MFTKRTLFILGAGASMPYGLPSGAELRVALCDLLRQPFTPTLMREFGLTGPDLQEFSQAFLKSRQPSIDTFLAKRQT